MQTFLPFPEFELSAKALDYRRLGKQRVEAKQILNALARGSGWQNHPAVRMWRGHQRLLSLYGMAICTEWRARGYQDTLLDFFEEGAERFVPEPDPWWIGCVRFHDSHKARLFEKEPLLYPQFRSAINQPCCPECNYYWPTHVRRPL